MKKTYPKIPEGFKKGRIGPLSSCCADIQLCCIGVVGDVTNGWNHRTQRQETVMVIVGLKKNECGSTFRPKEIIVVELKPILVKIKTKKT